MESLDQYLQEKNVEELLSNLVFEISLHRPQDVKKFIMEYLDRHGTLFGSSTSTSSSPYGNCCCQHSQTRNESKFENESQGARSPDFQTPPNQSTKQGKRVSSSEKAASQVQPKYFPSSPPLIVNDPHANLSRFSMSSSSGKSKDEESKILSSHDSDEEEYSNQKLDYGNRDVEMESKLSTYKMSNSNKTDEYDNCDEEEGLSEVSVIDNRQSLMKFRKYSISVQPTRRKSIVGDSISLDDLLNFVPPSYPKTDESNVFLQSCLSENVLFKNLDEEELSKVFDSMKKVTFRGGEILIKQGSDGDYFYVLAEGICNIFVSPNVKSEEFESGNYGKLVKVCNKFDSFGELALMYNQVRAATVVAASNKVKTYAIDRMTFRKLMMEQTISKRKRYVSFLENVPILKQLTKYEKYKIADALEPQTFFKNDMILRQGDVGNMFFIIEFGEVEVTKFLDEDDDSNELSDGTLRRLHHMRETNTLRYKKKKKEEEVQEEEEDEETEGEKKKKINIEKKRSVILEDYPGNICELSCVTLTQENYFGELALLNDCRRQASCIGKSELIRCASLSRSRFDRLLGPCIEIMKRNQENYKLYVKKK